MATGSLMPTRSPWASTRPTRTPTASPTASTPIPWSTTPARTAAAGAGADERLRRTGDTSSDEGCPRPRPAHALQVDPAVAIEAQPLALEKLALNVGPEAVPMAAAAGGGDDALPRPDG